MVLVVKLTWKLSGLTKQKQQNKRCCFHLYEPVQTLVLCPGNKIKLKCSIRMETFETDISTGVFFFVQLANFSFKLANSWTQYHGPFHGIDELSY